MEEKKNKKYIICLVVFLIITILFGTLFILEKTNKKEITINYLTNYYTQALHTDKIYYKTLVLKAFGDDGTVENIFNMKLNDYEVGSHGPVLYCRTNNFNIMTNTNKLKLYYEYNVKVATTGSILSSHMFIDLEYEVLENKQIKFISADCIMPDSNNIRTVPLENTIYQEHNLSTFYVNKTVDLGFSLRFDLISVVS